MTRIEQVNVEHMGEVIALIVIETLAALLFVGLIAAVLFTGLSWVAGQ